MRIVLVVALLALAACEQTRLSEEHPTETPMQQITQCFYQPELEWC